MRGRIHQLFRGAAAVMLLLLLLGINVQAGGKNFEGRWLLTITIPESPTSNSKRTITVTVEASPRGDSLNGRLTATDDNNRTVSGAWRQVGKQVSITYELPCADDGSTVCASLVMLGKVKGESVKKGKVIVMWDTQSDTNPALYDTANGSFNGERLP
jgi:predicted RecA/RadA family phage recombinase